MKEKQENNLAKVLIYKVPSQKKSFLLSQNLPDKSGRTGSFFSTAMTLFVSLSKVNVVEM